MFSSLVAQVPFKKKSEVTENLVDFFSTYIFKDKLKEKE